MLHDMGPCMAQALALLQQTLLRLSYAMQDPWLGPI